MVYLFDGFGTKSGITAVNKFCTAKVLEDFSFQRAAIQVELPEGAYVSEDTNCLITELGGQYLVNLGVQDAALAITNGEVSRDYLFNINLI